MQPVEPNSPTWGRADELRLLQDFLGEASAGLALVTGPRGAGKTTLLADALRGREAVHFQALPLPAEALLHDLEGTLQAVLGEVPGPRTPGLLPLSTPHARWEALLAGLLDRTRPGRPLIVALDGGEHLLGASRTWGPALAGTVALARERGAPLKVILAGRGKETLRGALGRGDGAAAPDTEVELGSLPYRTAGWAHGARSAREAFLFWAVFGDHPSNLPWCLPPGRSPGPPSPEESDAGIGADLDGRAIARILHPAGDLFDAPLHRLEATFQRPARYLALLRTLARGPLDWGRIVALTPGLTSGGQLAPYLRRLEEAGFVRAERPMGSEDGSRNRRYLLTDPFLAFWCGLVLPHRSLLPRPGAEVVWRERILPGLEAHLNRWLARAGLQWLEAHAEEALPAPARSVGGLWDEEAEFDAVGWLETGQVCYLLARWSNRSGDGEGLHREMAARMKATRYGIGREARGPVYLVAGDPGDELRRQAARNPLARVLGLEELMGTAPPPGLRAKAAAPHPG